MTPASATNNPVWPLYHMFSTLMNVGPDAGELIRWNTDHINSDSLSHLTSFKYYKRIKVGQCCSFTCINLATLTHHWSLNIHHSTTACWRLQGTVEEQPPIRVQKMVLLYEGQSMPQWGRGLLKGYNRLCTESCGVREDVSLPTLENREYVPPINNVEENIYRPI